MARKLFTRTVKTTHVTADITYEKDDAVVTETREFAFEDVELTDPVKIKKMVRRELDIRGALIQVKDTNFTSESYAIPVKDVQMLSAIFSWNEKEYEKAMAAIEAIYNDAFGQEE